MEEFSVEVNGLLEVINEKYHVDFRHYTVSSVRRSLHFAMERLQIESISVLKRQILENENTFAELLRFLTNPVSEFFRDPEYFLALREKVIPFLKTYPSIKIWVAGCSTGEEVYSLAILLHEENLLDRSMIYATDINDRSLAAAKLGNFDLEMIKSYSANYLRAGGKARLSDYYVVDLLTASIRPELRLNLTFNDHSLVTDAVFIETHLISCRNVLIYFDRQLQDRAIGLFYESLGPKGFLGLGSKETIQFSSYAKNFDSVAKLERIFQKNRLPHGP